MLSPRLVLLLLLLSPGSPASAEADSSADIPADKETIIFDSRLGNITFAHKAHSGLKNVECRTCHHTYPDEYGLQNCHNCHKHEQDDPPKAMDAFHIRCRGCHKYTVESGGKAGPVKKCLLCHRRETTP